MPVFRSLRVFLAQPSLPKCIHSFIHTISIAPLQVLYYSQALPTARILCRNFPPKRQRQLRVKDVPKVPTWRLERESNPRPFGRKASTLPKRLHVPQMNPFLLLNPKMHKIYTQNQWRPALEIITPSKKNAFWFCLRNNHLIINI